MRRAIPWSHARRPWRPTGCVRVELRGSLRPSDIPALCDRLRDRITGAGVRIALCDAARAAPDAVTLDAIAHLALTARRSGCHLMVERATDELLDLADALGFAEVLLT